MKRIAVHGSYHTANFGDLLLLELTSRHILSHFGVRAMCPDMTTCYGKPITAQKTSFLRSMLRASGGIFSGGGYLENSDAAATRRLLRYTVVAKAWRMQRVPYIFVGVGAGPVLEGKGARRVAAMCNFAEAVLVRDEESYEVLTNAGVHDEKLAVTADLAITLQRDYIPVPACKRAAELLGPRRKPHRIGLHLPTTPQCVDTVEQVIRQFAFGLGAAVLDCEIFWIFDHGRPNEDRLRSIAARYLPQSQFIPNQDTWTLVAILGEFDALFTTKLHVGIVGWTLGTAICGFSAHPKSKRFYRQIGRSEFQTDLNAVKHEPEDWAQLFITDTQLFRQEDHAARAALAEQAQKNFIAIDRFLVVQVGLPLVQ